MKYFGDYYYWVFNDPVEKFKEFRENEGYSYPYYSQLFNVSNYALRKIDGGKTELSYSMYLKFIELGVFKELKKRKL